MLRLKIVVVSILSTDVVVVMQFYRHGHTLWAMLAAGFVVVPFAVMNIISIKWKRADRSLSRLSVLMHASLLAPIQRCVLCKTFTHTLAQLHFCFLDMFDYFSILLCSLSYYFEYSNTLCLYLIDF